MFGTRIFRVRGPGVREFQGAFSGFSRALWCIRRSRVQLRMGFRDVEIQSVITLAQYLALHALRL